MTANRIIGYIVTTVLILAVVAIAIVGFLRLRGDSPIESSAIPSPSERPGEQGTTVQGAGPDSNSGSEGASQREPVAANRVTVNASSALPPDADNGITYDATNTLDADTSTAWNSESDTDGKGETLTFRFSEPVGVGAIQFVNGYAKSDAVFNANHRARLLLVTSDERRHEVTLLDTPQRQEIEYDFGLTSKVVIEVLEIYPGDGFETEGLTADLAITEVEFFTQP